MQYLFLFYFLSFITTVQVLLLITIDVLCLSFNGSWVGNEWHSMFTAVHVGLITRSLIIGKTKVSVKVSVSVSAIHLTGSIGIGIANTFFCEYRYRYRRYFYKVSLTTLCI